MAIVSGYSYYTSRITDYYASVAPRIRQEEAVIGDEERNSEYIKPVDLPGFDKVGPRPMWERHLDELKMPLWKKELKEARRPEGEKRLEEQQSPVASTAESTAFSGPRTDQLDAYTLTFSQISGAQFDAYR